MLVLAARRRVAEVEKRRRRRRRWWEDERRYKTASVAGLLGGKAGQRLRCFSQGEFVVMFVLRIRVMRIQTFATW